MSSHRTLDDEPETGLLQGMTRSSKSSSESWLSRFIEVNAGFLLVGAAQAFFALMDLAVKLLNEIDPPVPTLELIDVRMAITYLFCIAYMLCVKVPDPFLGPRGIRKLLAIRGFCGFAGLFGTYYSLRYLSLSDATALFFLAPLGTALVASLFLREPLHLREILAGVISLLGVVLIARPEAIFGSPGTKRFSGEGTPQERLAAVGVALLGVIGASGAYTSIRAIGNRAHAMHSMAYFSLWCVIASTIGYDDSDSGIGGDPYTPYMAHLACPHRDFGFAAQMLLTLGFQRAEAGRSAMAIYVQMIFAIVLERIFFHTTPSALSITGIVVIMGSAVFVVLTRQSKGSDEADIDKPDPDVENGQQDAETRNLIDSNEQHTHYASTSDGVSR